ncbi:MAG: histidine phosphatase family protein, partial [Alphaproteobacteria bacterium]|nr:histidine phosphatase family protein [Alphaproteobacteria bacterium]
ICIGSSDVDCVEPDPDILAKISAQVPDDATSLTSPLLRARRTFAALPGFARADCEPAFAEQDFGAWEGQIYEHIDTDWSSPATLRPPGGESFADVVTRVHEAIDRIDAPELLVVAHAGPIRAAVAKALDLTPERALALQIQPLSLTCVVRHGHGWSVEFVNRL